LASPEYTAWKHHVPADFGMNKAEVAVAVLPAPCATCTPAPTVVPPVAQPSALANGPQMKKLTVPVGLPPMGLPLTVAVSVFEPPRTSV
jgi:hypothetical protein